MHRSCYLQISTLLPLALFISWPLMATNLILLPTQRITPPTTQRDEDDIPLTEDLMREHGILNRILLAYEEVIRRIDANEFVPINTVHQAVHIIKTFIEEYHEKNEENYLFPLFEKHNKEVALVGTLKEQHIQGRALTAKILDLITKGRAGMSLKQKRELKVLLQKFITMYRPHEAREDTVLFPLVRSLMSEAEFKALSQKFEESEHVLFGKHGFTKILEKVVKIEQDLGIYDLNQFTPYTAQMAQ